MEYNYWIDFICFGFVFISFLIEYFLLAKDFEADYKIRSQRKDFPKYGIVFTVAFLLFLVLIGMDFTTIGFIILVFAVIMARLLLGIFYKKKKPYTLFIKGNELVLKREWIQKRDLRDLTDILYDRLYKEFWLYFKRNSRISIPTGEYEKEDIENFLKILLEKSDYDVSIPDNYKEILEPEAHKE